MCWPPCGLPSAAVRHSRAACGRQLAASVLGRALPGWQPSAGGMGSGGGLGPLTIRPFDVCRGGGGGGCETARASTRRGGPRNASGRGSEMRSAGVEIPIGDSISSRKCGWQGIVTAACTVAAAVYCSLWRDFMFLDLRAQLARPLARPPARAPAGGQAQLRWPRAAASRRAGAPLSAAAGAFPPHLQQGVGADGSWDGHFPRGRQRGAGHTDALIIVHHSPGGLQRTSSRKGPGWGGMWTVWKGTAPAAALLGRQLCLLACGGGARGVRLRGC